ncbi:hypothetical protein BDV12DRAFT_203968 [Aspergillus spectabilis]
MDDTPTRPAHKKRHDVFGRLKNALTRRSKDKDTPPPAPKPSASATSAKPDAQSSSANPETDGSKIDKHDAKNHWQVAYDELTESEQDTLATLLPAMTTEPQDAGRARTREILDQVVKATETQYKENPRKDDSRATAHKILNCVLSFQTVVDNAVKFDPTGYASSAWAIVSLGLTMAKNHADLRHALLDSSGYLADLLARCAFIEDQFYRGIGSAFTNIEKEKSIIRVYVAILQYSAQIRSVQQYDNGRYIVESITAVTSQQLAQLKTLIKEEESHLHHWLLMDQHLHRKAEAEDILRHIDTIMMNIEKVHKAVDMLNLPYANGAFFESFMDQHEGECLPGTRTKLLRQVHDWERSSNRCIFWLSGMAGTGKSTIARTVARSFKEDGTLGASFFFKRGRGDRASAAKFFPTIVKQLTVHIPQMIAGIQKAVEDDPVIANKSLPEQFDKLMLQPLLAVDQDQAVSSTMVVIDALDECEPKEDLKIILHLLAKVVTATSMPIRFFLTSRPEQLIRLELEQIGEGHYQHTPLHTIDDGVTKHDITLYLKEKFAEIQQSPEHNLPQAWPGEEQIEALATRAAPLFIFAATVCRFVADSNFDPKERLQEFLTKSSGSKLDDTYRPVLKQLLVKDESDRDKLITEFQKIIGAIIFLAAPLSLSSLAELLELQERHVSIRLRSFHSVLIIPSDPNLPIQTFHLSFQDYLLDEGTKTDTEISRFWVNKGEKHELITRQCLSVMGRYLRKNICGLPNYGTSRTRIDPASVARLLPPALQYACRYWVYHLNQSTAPARILDQALPILKEHFLHWLESMSILGFISETLNSVDTLIKLAKDASDNTISLFLLDARKFILKFAQIVDTAPLQLYSSGLIFVPQKALIRGSFERELPSWLCRGPTVEENWSPELQTLEGHSNWVQSVAFSQDGQLLASCSADQTIKLWDPATGTLKHTLEGHSSWIQSVAFSQDSQLLASGSIDQTIKLWDPATGTIKQTLEGHSNSVESVAFFHDGQLLASGSDDKTIKLWDPATGTLKHTLKGHSSTVQSVAFSQDGQHLASCSADQTIKLWNPATGTLKYTLEGHSDWSVAFSQDSQLLASGASDQTIKLWNPATGTLKYTLEGHSSTVQSVAFSQGGRLLGSGSGDKTIKLWDPATGTLKHTLKGHSSTVQSVAFSQGGRLLASGSGDKTIKLWDPAISTPKHTLEGHSDLVQLVAFSQDGRLLASGSNDYTIKLWDPTTGTLKHTLEGHSSWVRSVVFSQDGQLLASGSDDRTIKLWDPATGTLKHTLEEHSGYVWSVAFTQDGRLLASGSNDETINLWDPATGTLKYTLEGHSSTVQSVAFSQDGRLLASGSNDCTIKLWDPATGTLKHTLEGHSDWVQSVAFSQDGQLLASGSRDQTIKLWDPATGTLKHTLAADGHVTKIEFSKKILLLHTNVGSYDIHAWHQGFSSTASEISSEVSLQAGRWVAIQGQKQLWLPPDYQPACSTISGGTIAFGCKNGRVCMITISI